MSEEEEDYEFDIGSDDEEFYQAPAAPVPPVPRAAIPNPAAVFQQNPPRRFLNPNAFAAGFGGHAFARPPASAFRRQYRAYSTAILEIQQGRGHGTGGRSNLMYGGKIVMPPSALDELTQLDIELPITFELKNPAFPDLNTHVGVLEFIAEEGQVNLPQWVMDRLRLNEGDPIRIWGARMPKGKMIKIQPQSVDFLELSDPKAVLEQALRNFSCLTAGDIIEIAYQSLNFRILVMEITPEGPGISCIDTDLEVDFAAPLGYIEPERKPAGPIATMKTKFVIDTSSKQSVDSKGTGESTSWEAFKGSGLSVGGKRVKGKGIKAKKVEAVDEGSLIQRTDQTRIITSDVQIGGRHVPAALNLPFGNLFFGFENLRGPPGSASELAADETIPAVPFAAVGTGNTLSGRTRSRATTPFSASTPEIAGSAAARAQTVAPQEEKPIVPFAGAGQSMSGRRPIETIIID